MALDVDTRLQNIFMPYAMERMAKARAEQTRFVYYTSADTAMRIISNREVWLRNAATMNDFMEVQHGLRSLRRAWKGGPGKRLREVLTPHFENFFEELGRRFDRWSTHFENDTFVLCVSEHLDHENRTGRLSMWRAYGGGNGVALVLNNTPFLNESDALSAYTTPVAYLSDEAFSAAFDRVVDNIAANIDFLVEQGEDTVLSWLFHMMRFAVVSTKHEGFAEEREWRVVHAPALEPSERLICSVESVRGVPQRVYKLPLKNFPEEHFVGAEIHELLERIIIGPSRYPVTCADALWTLLQRAGIQNPQNRIVISDIPLRTDL